MSPRAEDLGSSRSTDLADAAGPYRRSPATATITAPGATGTLVGSTELARWLYAIDDPFFALPPAGRPHPTS
jgi:hypothetical protein